MNLFDAIINFNWHLVVLVATQIEVQLAVLGLVASLVAVHFYLVETYLLCLRCILTLNIIILKKELILAIFLDSTKITNDITKLTECNLTSFIVR